MVEEGGFGAGQGGLVAGAGEVGFARGESGGRIGADEAGEGGGEIAADPVGLKDDQAVTAEEVGHAAGEGACEGFAGAGGEALDGGVEVGLVAVYLAHERLEGGELVLLLVEDDAREGLAAARHAGEGDLLQVVVAVEDPSVVDLGDVVVVCVVPEHGDDGGPPLFAQGAGEGDGLHALPE